MSTAVSFLERLDYRPSPWRIPRTDLVFELDPGATRVHSRLELEGEGGTLELDGRGLELVALRLDGRDLPAERWTHLPDQDRLVLRDLPAKCVLELETVCHPDRNTALEGLYYSGGKLVTQCEAHGFRCITFFLDRPDVPSRFTVTLRGSRESFPALLSNGDPLSERDLEGGRHEAVWQDPHPKPCYLFALVAGPLVYREQYHTTAEGRRVSLRVYVEEHNREKCDHALASLKRSMAWDEKHYGLCYDLSRYSIVAVADFNAGAMENKGLNIFNSQAVLASPETTIDDRFLYVERVVAHEYFHNWSGNRVTLRDWFQLTLKEGLTIFRDQEFTADTHSRALKRIDDVLALRERQFPEDNGPLAHPIRPERVADIDNFYTTTIYEKGAEVLRMLHTLVGPAAWRQAMDDYFRRFDGQGVTCDDLLDTVSRASGRDLSAFARWYGRAGTPRVSVTRHWDAGAGRLRLEARQRMADHQGGDSLPPLVIPLRLALFDREGQALPLGPGETERVELLDEHQCTWVYEGLPPGPQAPVASVLRAFSAPVLLEEDLDDRERLLLLAHDTDPFNRWEAGQRLGGQAILAWQSAQAEGRPAPDLDAYARALDRVLEDPALDPMMKAAFLNLPGFESLAGRCVPLDPLALYEARRAVIRRLAGQLEPRLRTLYHSLEGRGPWRWDFAEHGRRTLRNTCLGWLSRLEQAEVLEWTRQQYLRADNMSDRQAALAILAEQEDGASQALCHDFPGRYRDHAEVVDAWLGVMARSSAPGGLDRVKALQRLPEWQPANPNRVRAVVGGFVSNVSQFHGEGQAACDWFAEQVVATARLNAYVAANLTRTLGTWRRYRPERAAMLRACLERIRSSAGLPAKVAEVCELALADGGRGEQG